MANQYINLGNHEIDLQYDNFEYSVDVSEKDKIIVLRRLEDNKVIKVFNDQISFLVQVGNYCPSFVIVTLDENKQPKLIHYVDYKNRDFLEIEDEYDVKSTRLKDIRLSEKSFIVEQKNNGGTIFTVKGRAAYYDRIYKDRRIYDIIGKNIVMVDQVKRGKQNDEIEDTLTYGINPDTKEIVTPIWSRLQNRLINVYTKEDIENIRNNRDSMNLSSCDYSYLNTAETPFVGFGDATMHFEVDRYIELLEKYIEKSDSIYEDKYNRKINEKFVKKFVLNKVKKRMD